MTVWLDKRKLGRAMRAHAVAVAVALALLLGSSPRAGAQKPSESSPDLGHAATGVDAAAAARFALAEAEDVRGDYSHAVTDYRATVASLPSFRYAAKATMRAALLEAHSEGDWAPFAQLEAVRRDPSLSSDPKAIDSLAASADTFPAGPTRSEARMLCAEAYVARLHRRADGESALRKVIDDPRADGLMRRAAASQLVTALIDDGNLDAAQGTVLALGPALDPKMAKRVTELVRRGRVHIVAVADLVLFFLLGATAIARASSRGALAEVGVALKQTLPLALFFAAYVGLAGGALASEYETGNGAPFFNFGVVLVPVAIVARAWGAAGSTGGGARLGRALLSGSAVVAAAFLMLEKVNGQYLEGFKL